MGKAPLMHAWVRARRSLDVLVLDGACVCDGAGVDAGVDA